MNIKYYSDPKQFKEIIDPILHGDYAATAQNSLLISIALGIINGRYTKEEPTMGIVYDGKKVDLIFEMTPPERPMVISNGSKEALELLANDLYQKRVDLFGMLGPVDEVNIFCDLWNRLNGNKTKLAVEEGVYVLENVITPQEVEGTLRTASEDDLETVFQFSVDFYLEALPHDPLDREEIKKGIKRGIDNKFYHLWIVNGESVSLVGASSSSDLFSKLAPVYTPPKFRKRGYGAAATAAVSKFKLDEGRKFCSLYTDLSNPTSNSIYQKVGYKRVGTLRFNKFV